MNPPPRSRPPSYSTADCPAAGARTGSTHTMCTSPSSTVAVQGGFSHFVCRTRTLTRLVNEPVEVPRPDLCLEKLLPECKLNGVRRSVDARDIYLAPVHKPHALLTMYYPHPSRLARSSMPKQNCSHGVNVVCNGSPSRIRIVRRISFGITTRPKSSILRTIPVAFIYISPLAQIVFRDIVCSFWEFIQWRDECRNRRIS